MAAAGTKSRPRARIPNASRETQAIMAGLRNPYTSFESTARNFPMYGGGRVGHGYHYDSHASSAWGKMDPYFSGYQSTAASSYIGYGYPNQRHSKDKKSNPPKSKDVNTKSWVIKSDNVVTFFGRDHFLSNFYKSDFVVNGHTYPTVEHYYEACKIFALAGSEYARSLKGIADPGATKAAAKRMLSHVAKNAVDHWRMHDGVLVMKVAITEKFRQNHSLSQKLLQTGDALLSQCSKYDSLWSTGCDEDEFKSWINTNNGKSLQLPTELKPEFVGNFPKLAKGRNLQGFLLMILREQLGSDIKLAAQLIANTVPLSVATTAAAIAAATCEASSSSEFNKETTPSAGQTSTDGIKSTVKPLSVADTLSNLNKNKGLL